MSLRPNSVNPRIQNAVRLLMPRTNSHPKLAREWHAESRIPGDLMRAVHKQSASARGGGAPAVPPESSRSRSPRAPCRVSRTKNRTSRRDRPRSGSVRDECGSAALCTSKKALRADGREQELALEGGERDSVNAPQLIIEILCICGERIVYPSRSNREAASSMVGHAGRVTS